jgi:hypothetical protein
VQYRIITVCSCWSPTKALERLAREVNDAIKQGWEPQGGVAVAGTRFVQAMIKPR